jgi:replicative DNA helicase
MMINPEAVGVAIEVLRENPEDVFYHEGHAQIYSAAATLFGTNRPVDAVTLVEQLTRDGTLESAGGMAYIADLTDAVPTSANVEHYAKIVLETALLRKIIATCSGFAGEAYEGKGDVTELLDRVEGEIFAIGEKRQLNPISQVKELLEDSIHRIEEQLKHGDRIVGVPTGFTKLDEKTSGFKPSDMIVLAARPSVGKTAFCLNIASYAALHANKATLIFSLEMAKEQLVQRLLCMEGHVDASRLRTGFLARSEFPKLQRAAAALNNAHIYIDDTPNISVMELRSKARRHASKKPLDMIIIDYLQLMGGTGRSESRQVEIADISRAVKGIARELRVPVIALSQLSREAERDESGGPKLSHLRESGAIEQDADVVMMLSRLPEHEREGRENVIRLNVAKQRNGPTGVLELLFEKEIQRFRNIGEAAGGIAPPPVDYAPSSEPFDYEDDFEEDDTPF